MTASHRQNDLRELLDALSTGALDGAQAASLEDILARDPAARQLYVTYMHLRVNSQYLADIQLAPLDAADLAEALGEEEAGNGHWAGGSTAPNLPISQSPSASAPPIVIQPSVASLSFTPPSFVGGLLLSYLTAALVLSVGLAIAWAWKLPNDPWVARQSVPPTVEGRPATESRVESIGRITGMVDCQWDNGAGRRQIQSPIPNLQSLVCLGDKFVLASGLMEITYDTGAKVILQGPVAYQVESSSGGFLSVGKLTARLQKGDDGRRKAEQSPNLQIPKSPNPKSPFPLPPSPFAVRTPTATVTDLGTEFGVTVSQLGVTQVHVLQGTVVAQVVDAHGGAPRRQHVSEGVAVEIGRQERDFRAVAFAPQSFTRKLQRATDAPAETAYIQAVLADKPMGYWPLNEPAGARKFFDRSGNGVHGYAMSRVAAGQSGPLPGGRAIQLDGDGYIDFGLCNQLAMKNAFTVEAWVWIGKPEWSSHVISVLGLEGGHHIGWGLIAGRRNPDSKDDAKNPVVLHFIVYGVTEAYFPRSSSATLAERWHHVAVVYDGANTAHLYLDGEPCGAVAIGRPAYAGPVWMTIGTADVMDVDFWRGRLAHVAVYPHVLSHQQIQNHYGQCGRRDQGDGRGFPR
jgi:hypothetical protein